MIEEGIVVQNDSEVEVAFEVDCIFCIRCREHVAVTDDSIGERFMTDHKGHPLQLHGEITEPQSLFGKEIQYCMTEMEVQ